MNKNRTFRQLALTALLALALPAAATAQEGAQAPGAEPQKWRDWLARLQTAFAAEGIAPQTFAAALGGTLPDARVLEADSRQPEFTRPIWEYLDTAVSPRRIEQGQEMLARHAGLLAGIEAEHGVPAEILVAIWGIETNYGGNKGNFHVPRSLATLAWGSDRHGFGRRQLLAALRLLQEGVATPEAMRGSWAGAMGHTQFLPTTYEEHGIDGDGDGRRDLFASEADALASAANYLRASGWQTGETWGVEAALPAGFDHGLARASVRKHGAEWARLGVSRPQGELPAAEGFLLLPAGHRGPAFLALGNFAVLKRYNPSTAYALAVGRLADCLRGCSPLAVAWPRQDGTLSRSEKMALQRRLTALGFDTQGIDGIVGPATREALRGWQAAQGKAVDGYPTRALLEQMQAER